MKTFNQWLMEADWNTAEREQSWSDDLAKKTPAELHRQGVIHRSYKWSKKHLRGGQLSDDQVSHYDDGYEGRPLRASKGDKR